MSDQVVKEIIERAIEDETFRANLFSNPQSALAGYDLDASERALLENLNEGNFDEFAGKLSDRGTKGVIRPGFG